MFTRAGKQVGQLHYEEPAEGVLVVRPVGHLTRAVGDAFPLAARAAAERVAACSVWLDLRRLEGFELAVQESWASALLEFRHRVQKVVVLSTRPLLTLQAKAAGVVLRPLGVDFRVGSDAAAFERELAAAARPRPLRAAQ